MRTQYRVHSTDPKSIPSELQPILDDISKRLQLLEGGTTNPINVKADLDMSGGQNDLPIDPITHQHIRHQIHHLAEATDDHDAVTLGQLTDAIQSLKDYVDSGTINNQVSASSSGGITTTVTLNSAIAHVGKVKFVRKSALSP